MHLDTLPVDAVETRLHGLAFDYLDLQIPPRMQSEFAMECDFAEQNADVRGKLSSKVAPFYERHGHSLNVMEYEYPADAGTQKIEVGFETKLPGFLLPVFCANFKIELSGGGGDETLAMR